MAYDFVASSSEYLSTTSTPITNGPMTVACWYQVKDDTSNSTLISIGDTNGSEQFLFSSNGSASPKRVMQWIYVDSAVNIPNITFSNAAYSVDTWYHAAGTVNGAQNGVTTRTFNPYFNGTIGTVQVAGPATFNGNIDRILIGARYSTSLGNYINGLVAEVGIWDVELTAAEIASLAKGMKCNRVRPQSLRFYAPLVRELIDTDEARAITNNNTATVVAHPRVY